jgi:hypothetical protein
VEKQKFGPSQNSALFTPTRPTRSAVLEVQAEISTVWLIFSAAAAAAPCL